MAKKLSAEDSSRLDRALASWQDWRVVPSSQPEIQGQLGGDSNLSFLLGDGASQWVLRLNNPLTDTGISRDNELLAIQAASQAGFAPAPIYQSNEFIVTPFIAGAELSLDDLPQIGMLFRRVHALPVRLKPIDLLRHLTNYYEKANPDPRLDDCYLRVVEMYPQQAMDLKPCHNDCLLPNIIAAQQGLMLIDWEYAAAADPAYDLAVFTATYGVKEARLESLLSAYGVEDVREVQDLIARIKYFEKYYRLIEILWWGLRGQNMSVPLDVMLQEFSDS
jgi:thiamine kinase